MRRWFWRAYRWLYRQLTWCTIEQACSDDPLPWYTRAARRWLPDPYDYGKAGVASRADAADRGQDR